MRLYHHCRPFKLESTTPVLWVALIIIKTENSSVSNLVSVLFQCHFKCKCLHVRLNFKLHVVHGIICYRLKFATGQKQNHGRIRTPISSEKYQVLYTVNRLTFIYSQQRFSFQREVYIRPRLTLVVTFLMCTRQAFISHEKSTISLKLCLRKINLWYDQKDISSERDKFRERLAKHNKWIYF